MADRYVKLDDVISIIKDVNGNLGGLIQHLKEHCPTADVVSKSEVDRLTEELKTYNRVCGKLLIKDGVVVGKEVGKEVEYIHRDIAKILKQIAVNQTKIEVAKKIFEEIESILEPIIRLNYAISVQHEDAIERAKAISAEQALRAFRDYVAELKKKYTEGE